MSGSPKYTPVSSGQLRRQQAERERAERERRRQEQLRRERAAAVAAAKVVARAASRALYDRWTRVRREATVAEPSLLSAVDRMETSQRERETAINTSQDLNAINATIQRIEAANRELADVRTRVLARQRREVVERIDALVAALEEIPREQRNGHDPAGADAVDQLLDDARRRVRSDPIGSADRVDRLAEGVSRHLATVMGQQDIQRQQWRTAEQAVADLNARLEVLIADAHTTAVPLADGEQIRASVAGLASALADGHLAYVLDSVNEVSARINAAESTLDEAIDGMAERRALLESIIAALPDLDFAVDTDSLEETTDGALALRATRLTNGEGFAVLVAAGPDGSPEVLYTTDSMREADAGGTGRACGSLIDVIEAISEDVRRDGFEPGDIRWSDDGYRPPTGGGLPLGADKRRTQGGAR